MSKPFTNTSYADKPYSLNPSPTVWTGPVTGAKPLGPVPQVLKDITEGIHPPSSYGYAQLGLNAPTINLTPEQEQKVKEMMTAIRYDEGKTDWSLMPFEAVEEINKVLEFGAKKYAPNNWKKGFPVNKVLNSCLRHLFSYMRGEKVDPESGLSHISHAACNLLFILYFLKYKEKYSTFLPDEKNT